VKRKRSLVGNLATIHAIVWGQCSDAMKAKRKSSKDYETKTTDNDSHWLLRQVRSITLQFDQKRNPYVSLFDAKSSFYRCRQRQGQSVNSYNEEMCGWVDIIEHHDGSVGESHTLVDEDDEDGNRLTIAERTSIARDRTLGIALLRGADPTRYGTLITDIANRFVMGSDVYPSDMTAAYSLLVN
jgi:hypothetical protein